MGMFWRKERHHCSLPLMSFPLLLRRAQRHSGLCVGVPKATHAAGAAFPKHPQIAHLFLDRGLGLPTEGFSLLHAGVHFLTFQAGESFVETTCLCGQLRVFAVPFSVC